MQHNRRTGFALRIAARLPTESRAAPAHINSWVKQCLPRFADLKKKIIDAVYLQWLSAIWTRASLHKATADNGFETGVRAHVESRQMTGGASETYLTQV